MEDQNDSQTPDMQPEQQFDPEIEAPTQPVNMSQPAQAQVFQSPAQAQPAPAEPVSQQPAVTQATQPAFTPGLGATVPQAVPAEPLAAYGNQPKRKKKWLIPVIALGIVVLAAGGASGYYFGVYQRPENVLLDAYGKLTSAKALQSDTVITFNKNLSGDMTLKDVKFKANSVANQAGMIDATIDMEYKGKAVPIGGKGIISLSDNTVYFQLNNIKQSVQAVIDAEKAASQVPAGLVEGIGKLQDKWVKVTVADLKESNQAAGNNLECAVNAVKKNSSGDNKEILDAFKKNPFISVKENLGVKDGRLGYKLAGDEAKLKEFGKSMENTQLYKDLKACNFDSSSSEESPSVDSAATDTIVYTVWVDQWTHELRKIELSGDTGTGTSKMTLDGSVNVAYDPSVKIDIPGDAITLEEYAKRYNDFAESMGMPDSSMLEDQYVPVSADSSNSI